MVFHSYVLVGHLVTDLVLDGLNITNTGTVSGRATVGMVSWAATLVSSITLTVMDSCNFD